MESIKKTKKKSSVIQARTLCTQVIHLQKIRCRFEQKSATLFLQVSNNYDSTWFTRANSELCDVQAALSIRFWSSNNKQKGTRGMIKGIFAEVTCHHQACAAGRTVLHLLVIAKHALQVARVVELKVLPSERVSPRNRVTEGSNSHATVGRW
jgi:hypothetical protein